MNRSIAIAATCLSLLVSVASAEQPVSVSVMPPAEAGFEFRWVKKGLIDRLEPSRIKPSELPWSIGPYVLLNGMPRYYVGSRLVVYTSRNSQGARIREEPEIRVRATRDSEKGNAPSAESISALLDGNVVELDPSSDRRVDLVVLMTGQPREVLISFVSANQTGDTLQLANSPDWTAVVAVKAGSHQPVNLKPVELVRGGRLHVRVPRETPETYIQGIHFRRKRSSESSLLFLDDITLHDDLKDDNQ